MARQLGDWRSIVSTVLVEEMGILGDMLIDETLEQIGESEDSLRFEMVMKFLRQLAQNLPADVDRKKIIIDIRDKLVEHYR